MLRSLAHHAGPDDRGRPAAADVAVAVEDLAKRYGDVRALDGVSLVGFGPLLGLLVLNANAINTYGAFFLIPLVGLAGAVFFVDTGAFMTILDLLPFSQAAKLLGDGMSAETPFDAGLASWAVIAVWALIGYAALARIATRREI